MTSEVGTNLRAVCPRGIGLVVLASWYWPRGTGAVVLEPGLLGVLGLIL